ncbi:MAG: hypothetical protein MJY62_03345 [Bacteroidales bacterium]|nr:hypothetical protein [Bacteroidales bacterium]
MKRHLIIVAAAVLAAVSCAREIIPDPVPGPTPVPDLEDRYNYITVSLPDDESFVWKEDDVLTIAGDEVQKYRIVPGFTSKVASFRGNDVPGKSFTVLLGDYESYAQAQAHDYSDQMQKANADTDHARPLMVLTGVTDISEITFSKEWAAGKGAGFRRSGLIKFSIESPAGVRVLSRISVKCSRPVLHKTNSEDSLTDSLALIFPDVDVSASRMKIRAFMLIAWQDIDFAEGDKLTITLGSGGKSVAKEISVTAGKVEAGDTYEIVADKKGWKGSATAEGSEGNPYKIATVDDMLAIQSRLVQNNIDGPIYFKMISDVDMSGVSWTPLVVTNACYPIDFDGAGHVISNLKVDGNVNFPSFIGVLDGAVHDVIFDKPYINCTASQAERVAVVAGWAGRSAGDITAEITNVEVRDADVNVRGAYASPTGILAGQANNATFTGCKVSGSVTAAGTATECNIGGVIGEIDDKCSVSNITSDVEVTVENTSRVIGGCIGSVRQACTIEDVHHKGILRIGGSGADYSGHLIGHIAGKVVVRNCSTEGSFSGSGKNSGGLIGSFFSGGSGSLVENCRVMITILAVPTTDYHGGLVGSFSQAGTNNITIRNCHVEGSLALEGTKGNIGGILGANWNGATGSVIDGCSFIGNIKTQTSGNGGSFIGGIIGYTQSITVRNCWTDGEISQCNYGIGGIAGCVYQNCLIQNCFSRMAITARHGHGGIAGRADNNSNDSKDTTGYDDTFDGCIAWNEKIVSRMNIASGNLSAGAIVGKTVSLNTHRNCWRRNDMTFTCFTDGQYNVLFDMPDNDSSTPLDYSASTAEPRKLGLYYWPYHGKSSNGQTASDIARTIGWDETVWDLSGSEPRLRK